MTKVEFLNQLKERLYGLPLEDVNRSVGYYEEMILDRIEDGATEEDAVSAVGTVEEVAKTILSAAPIKTLIKRSVKTVNYSKKKIIILCALSPIIIPLLVTLVAVIASLFATFYALVISYFAISVSSLAMGFLGLILFFPTLFTTGIAAALLHVGAGLFALGLGTVMLCGSKEVIRSAAYLSKKLLLCIKLCFIKGDKK